MERINAKDARGRLPEILRRTKVAGDRFLLCKHGDPFAAVVSVEDLAMLEQLEDHLDRLEARAALREAKEKGTVPFEEVARELGL